MMPINEYLSQKQLFKSGFNIPEDASADLLKRPCFLRRWSVDVRLFLSPQDSQEKNANPVKAEEAKLKAKYPGLAQKPGGSDFLMKRLQKGVGDCSLSKTWSEIRTVRRRVSVNKPPNPVQHAAVNGSNPSPILFLYVFECHLAAQLQRIVTEISLMEWDNLPRSSTVITDHQWRISEQMQPDISNMPSSSVVICLALLLQPLVLSQCFLPFI